MERGLGDMMSISHWILERNRDTAQLMWGDSDDPPIGVGPDQVARDERKAAALTPFIIGAAGAAVFGGAVGLSGKQRAACAGLAAVFFLTI